MYICAYFKKLSNLASCLKKFKRSRIMITPKLNTLFILLTLVILSFGCKEKKGQSETNKMAEVVAVHDEVMPKMSEIGKLVAKLRPIADSTETGLPYLTAMKDLQDAHALMMDWMKGFGDRFDYEEIMEGKPLDSQKEAWLLEEEVKVNAMREQVNQSIVNAQELLD